MRPILFVLKNGGLHSDVYKKLMEMFEKYKIKVLKQKIVYLKNKRKFCEEFYPEKYDLYEKEILGTFKHKVIALLVDIGNKSDIHIKIKRYIRQKYQTNVIHCSDDEKTAMKEYRVLKRQNLALFEGGNYNRDYEELLMEELSR